MFYAQSTSVVISGRPYAGKRRGRLCVWWGSSSLRNNHVPLPSTVCRKATWLAWVCWGPTSLLCSTSNTRMPESHVACMGCAGDQPVSFVPLPTHVCRKATWLAAMGCAGDQPVSSIIMLHFQTTLPHQPAIPYAVSAAFSLYTLSPFAIDVLKQSPEVTVIRRRRQIGTGGIGSAESPLGISHVPLLFKSKSDV